MTTRKCITQSCNNRIEPPARKCQQCKRASRKAARRRSAGSRSRTFTRPVAARVLSYTSPASSQIVGNGDFYRDRAERQADDDCAWCGGPHVTDPDEATHIDDWHALRAVCKFCGLTQCVCATPAEIRAAMIDLAVSNG